MTSHPFASDPEFDGGASGSTVGVIGIGRMGGALLPRLAAAFPVMAYDILRERRADVLRAGATWGASAVAVAARSAVLVTVLPGPGELQTVFDEMLPMMRPGTIWVDLTSGDPRVTAELAERAAKQNVMAAAAPMGGSSAEASTGDLTLYVSGPPAAVERVMPVLELLASADGRRHVGDHAHEGQTVKLLANALWFANASAATEALLIGTALGIEANHLRTLLQHSAGGSTALTDHLGHLLDGDYLESFEIGRVVEELDTVTALSRDTDTVTPILDASAALHRAARHCYGPALGELLGARLLEDAAGRRIRHHGPR